MRSAGHLALILALGLPAVGQGGTAPKSGLPEDPQSVFAAAAAFYDLGNPSLKPWHLKATYQLFDSKGKPGEQGTYEYWWASPKVDRSSWSRPAATHTEWHTANGERAYLATGESLDFLEYKLPWALLSPLPQATDLDPARVRFQMEKQKLFAGGEELACIMAVPVMPLYPRETEEAPFGMFPTHCFDPNRPVVRAVRVLGTVTLGLNNIEQVQGRFVARKIDLYDGKRQILSATVDTIDEISPSDPALTPAKEAKVTKLGKVRISESIALGMLVKKVAPLYPRDAEGARTSGTVSLRVNIGTDGAIRDMHILQAPSPTLASSAVFAVSHWKYRPYSINGEPVEMETTVNLDFAMSR
jgi:TonB family protein